MSPELKDFKYLSLQVIDEYNSDQKIKHKISLGEETFFGSNPLSASSSDRSIGLIETDVSIIDPQQFQQFIESLVDFLREEHWSETGISNWPKCQ
ncbi:hypothetical protein [Dermatophilus congolensis]|uniref:Uncharacterized protein n=1 Tax=Dermatophilus congolensis TaxID=1863 RepID=A0A239VAZ0_9MICO|nr:hypothetical protein [Dermatophilus congolensis]MBO3130539.1 hypothetical protein [Dermatophilus congolensis]MBO3130831.1 hypothetical protein [Dermatophilus congolensis]MBO3135011.1 hypothetical protein [Dermatophilus congolensis]MBO3137250.1 hypothetical protein [Dermatophilus congolensis]MBO3139495.1 hypothetical protein [Dermatophilus congolensis]